MAMNRKIWVEGNEISVILDSNQEYISLTDMLKAKDGDFFIADWLRNRNTIEYLGIWESIYNPDFNYGEFAIIKGQAGLNSYKLSVKEWVQQTNAIGLKASAGRYGGTYAHPDIAFEFGMWISPQFKIYLVKEFQRLKSDENNRLKLDWNLQRTLSKVNYQIHTDAIKENLIPQVAILVHTGPPFWRILDHRSGANPFIISICGTTFVSGINIRDSVTNNFITNNVITNKFIMYLY